MNDIFQKNEKTLENDWAVSSVIGVIMMVGMTVIMISAVAISVLGFSLPESAPQAKIVVREARGNEYRDKVGVCLKLEAANAASKEYSILHPRMKQDDPCKIERQYVDLGGIKSITF